MFGLKVPTGAEVDVEIRLSLARGAPFVVWDGSPDASDADVTGDILANRNALAYLWSAIDRGKLRPDDMGYVCVPARVVATQQDEVVFDEKVSIGLTMPPKGSDGAMSSQQLQRDILALLATAIGAIQKAACDAIEKVTSASANALKDVATANLKAMEKAHEAMRDTSTASTAALKDVAAANLKAMEKAHEALTTVATSADKLTGLAEKIFDDSRDRAAALVHEARKAATATKPESPMAEQVKDIRAMTDLMMMVKSITEDKSDGGSKK